MAEPLQNSALFRNLHIALFFLMTFFIGSSNAQSLLLPGDIVFVSVSSSANTFEFIPLVDLEKGTQFEISNGIWKVETNSFSDAQTVQIKALDKIFAGTPIKIGEGQVSGLEINGKAELSDDSEKLFIYQTDENKYRFVSAIGWGEKQGRRDRSFFGSEIPEVFLENPKSILKLGANNNYQYYIRNGASGTPKMLMEFTANPGFWRGNDEAGFSAFGTSFNILVPPVILFDQSLTTTEESKENTSIGVAIYEHDGSKLTVDLVFDSLYSSIDRKEIKGFGSKQINFTGLIGDAVYDVEIPMLNDVEYEGTETAIFSLQNLTNGRFGDFISHTVLISDDETPELRLEFSDQLGENLIMIHNLESKEVGLRNWELSKGDVKIIFPRGTTLAVGESLVIISEESLSLFSINGNYFKLDSEESEIFTSAGILELRDIKDRNIASLSIAKTEEAISSNILKDEISTFENTSSVNQSSFVSQTSAGEVAIPGWKSVNTKNVGIDEFAEVDFFYWSEQESAFLNAREDVSNIANDAILIGYFDEKSSSKLGTKKKSNLIDKSDQELAIRISATDIDKNGRIQNSEGLNFLKNNTDTVIPAGELTKYLNNKLNIVNGIKLFKSSPNFGKISAIKLDSYILAGEVFWLKLAEEMESKSVDINLQELNNTRTPIATEEIESGEITLQINGKTNDSEFSVLFIPDEMPHVSDQSLKLNKDVYLTNFNEVVLNGTIADEQFSKYSINQSSENITQIPLNFVAPESGEFELSVKNWTDIPNGWVIKIEDLKEEKTYEIHENWSLKFNYADVSPIQENEIYFPSVDERFVLRVIPEALVAKDENEELPLKAELNQNYPNPFNPTTTISFFIPEEAEVKVSVFNIVGQPVAVLLQERRGKGEHTLEWDASDMPSGIYIYQLEVGTSIMTRKMTLVK